MSLFDKLFKSLSLPTRSNLKAGGRQMLRQELIQRSDRFTEDYLQWARGSKSSEMLQAFQQQYQLKKYDSEQAPWVSIYQSAKANGVIFNYGEEYEMQEFEFLFDLIKEKTVSLKYISYVSDRIIYEKPKYLETVQKHYLKPDFTQNTGPKAHQLFGNILVELVSIDDNLSHLKLLATVYSDSKYHEPLPFDQYLGEIFGQD